MVISNHFTIPSDKEINMGKYEYGILQTVQQSSGPFVLGKWNQMITYQTSFLFFLKDKYRQNTLYYNSIISSYMYINMHSCIIQAFKVM